MTIGVSVAGVTEVAQRPRGEFMPWWTAAGIHPTVMVGWYEPIGAPSKAESLRDLSYNFGNYPVILEAGVIGWTTANGWQGANNSWFETNFNPIAARVVVNNIFCRIVDNTGFSDRFVFGSNAPAGNSDFSIKPNSGASSPGVEYGMGASVLSDVGNNFSGSGTLCCTRTASYTNGVNVGAGIAIPFANGRPTHLLAENAFGVLDQGFFEGTCQLILWATGPSWTDDQVAELHTLAMNLPTGGAW